MGNFVFYTKLDQTILLGRKADTIRALLEELRTVPESSVYYHTHRFLQQHHYLSPEPPNDFAYWVREVIGDSVLGERLSSVDIIQFHEIEQLRRRFIEILDDHVRNQEVAQRDARGKDFHFMASRIFVFPTEHIARDDKEFVDILGRVSINSLYYHIFDAKLRLEKGENDFSLWFADRGRLALAAELRKLDPYAYTLEGLRKRMLILVRKYGEH